MRRTKIRVLLVIVMLFGIVYATDLAGVRTLINSGVNLLAVGAEAVGDSLHGASGPDSSSPTGATRVPDGTLTVADARNALDTLKVQTSGTMHGYSRDRFPHWNDYPDACNTRERILKRDGTDVRVGGDCYPTSGSWYSPFDSRLETVPARVEIDHVTSLADAWRSGAAAWDQEKRQTFANDPRNLLAVSEASNQAKSDQTAGTWEPARAGYRCPFARMVITVKADYGLTLETAEQSRLRAFLDTCPASLASSARRGDSADPVGTSHAASRGDEVALVPAGVFAVGRRW